MKSDFAFANNIRAAVDLRVPHTSRLLLKATAAMFLVAFIWSNLAILDEVRRGNGRVVPSRQIQVVQSLEGGLVEAILVKEGDIVKQGAPLVRVDSTNFSSQFGEVRERRAAMAARVARLEAQATGKEAVSFPPELETEAPKALETETSLFAAYTRKLNQDLESLKEQELQKKRELGEYQASERKLNESLKLISRESALTRKLYEKKVVPEIEMIRADQKSAEVNGQLEVIHNSIPKAEAAIREAESKAATAKLTFQAQSGEDLAKSKADLAVLEETIKAAQDRVRRTELRSPVYGIVNKINVSTVGAVLSPGASVLDVVPLDDSLLVEAKVRPQDIAFIRPDQDAVVKITAYDPYVYGSLKGKVERISADVLPDEKEKGETYYRVMVRTGKNFLGDSAHPLPIIPGMVATVEILTGRKSVFSYITRPARVLKDEALRER